MERPLAMLTPDDPRLRDWVAGRLQPAAAAEVERLVRGSAELTRAVAVLRAAAGLAPEDEEVAAEWREIERQRIAAERAEAREDVESLARGAAGVPPDRRTATWPLTALVAALLAGVVLAVVVDRTIDALRDRDAEAIEAAAKDTFADAVSEGGDELDPAAPAQAPPLSAADAPPEGLGLRLRLRLPRSRQLLEELLAGSALRIGVDDGADAAGEGSAPERLTARGTPPAVDALLAALARRSDHFAMEAFAAPAGPPPPAGNVAAGVRLVLEIVDEPVADPAPASGPPSASTPQPGSGASAAGSASGPQ